MQVGRSVGKRFEGLSLVKTENRYQRNLNRLKGFCDGAGAKAMRTNLIDDIDYERGYTDGQKAKRDYAESSAKELGVSVREIVAL